MENEYSPVEYVYDIIDLHEDEMDYEDKGYNRDKKYEIKLSIVKSSLYYNIKISSSYYHSIIDKEYKLNGCYCIHSKNDIENNILRSICSEILYQHLSKLSYLIFKNYRRQLIIPPHVIFYKSILIPPIKYIWDYLYKLEDNQDDEDTSLSFFINL
nr:hypothetical protein [Parabacteroides goldsteinii]